MRSKQLSRRKRRALDTFAAHVSPAKAEFFRRLNMDFVLGRRAGPWLEDLDGRTRLYDLHGNGGVFNLGHRNPALVKVLTHALEGADIGNHHLMSGARNLERVDLSAETTLAGLQQRIRRFARSRRRRSWPSSSGTGARTSPGTSVPAFGPAARSSSTGTTSRQWRIRAPRASTSAGSGG